MPAANSPRPRRALRLEPLEPRHAPATFVSSTTATYQDADGDNVAVVFSKPFLTLANVNNVLTFDVGTVNGDNATKQQLRTVNLTGEPAAAGTAVTVTAVRSPATGGDGRANVGEVLGTGADVGVVTIDGDLGRVIAGDDAHATPALRGLAVQSMGLFGTATGAGDLHTIVVGALGFLRVRSDLRDVFIDARGASTAGRIGSVTVGGSVLGGAAANSGRIASGGDMGLVTIRGDLVGGSEGDSGRVDSQGKLAGVTVGGSVLGGAGDFSGRISSSLGLGPVRVGGNLTGGVGQSSGSIFSGRVMAGATVAGSVTGGAGNFSGTVSSGGGMGPVRVGRDLVGGTGLGSGAITDTSGPVASVTVGGSVRGGAGENSGAVRIFSPVGAISIGGDLIGGSATGTAALTGSGFILGQQIASLTIGGSVRAGTDDTTGTFADNGAIRVNNHIGSVLIKGSIVGNPTNPVVVSARGREVPTATSDVAIGRLTVLGRVEFAHILAGVTADGVARNADAQIGPVAVGGDWIASSLAAGAVPRADGFFGDDDAKMSGVKDDSLAFSKVASLAVGGQVMGTVGGTDHYGIVAEVVGALRVGGTLIPTITGQPKDDFFVGITADFKVNEV